MNNINNIDLPLPQQWPSALHQLRMTSLSLTNPVIMTWPISPPTCTWQRYRPPRSLRPKLRCLPRAPSSSRSDLLSRYVSPLTFDRRGRPGSQGCGSGHRGSVLPALNTRSLTHAHGGKIHRHRKRFLAAWCQGGCLRKRR